MLTFRQLWQKTSSWLSIWQDRHELMCCCHLSTVSQSSKNPLVLLSLHLTSSSALFKALFYAVSHFLIPFPVAWITWLLCLSQLLVFFVYDLSYPCIYPRQRFSFETLRWPIYFVNSVDNNKLPCYTLPPTQHHCFFRNLPPLCLCEPSYLPAESFDSTKDA